MQMIRFTMREMLTPRAKTMLAIWALVSVGAALTGPFGTYDALGLWGRLPYWALVAGGSILLSELVRRAQPGRWMRKSLHRLLAFGLLYGLVLSGLINLLNLLVFSGWPFWRGWLLLAGLVAGVEALAFSGLRLFRPPAAAVKAENPEAAFLKRLPPSQRGPLLRIESQDHYLLVVTTAGRAMILMRMGDAVAELAAADGMQVHRSHWVARRAMRGLRRDNGRLWLLVEGEDVPVSRANQAAIRALGLEMR